MALLKGELVASAWQVRLGTAKLLHLQALHSECANYCVEALRYLNEMGNVELVFLNFYAAVSYDCLSSPVFDSQRKLYYLNLARDHYNAAAAIASELSARHLLVRSGQRYKTRDRPPVEEGSSAWSSTPSLCSDPATAPESPSPQQSPRLQRQNRYELRPEKDHRQQKEVLHHNSQNEDQNSNPDIFTSPGNPSRQLNRGFDSLSKLMLKHAAYIERSQSDIVMAQKNSTALQDETTKADTKAMSIQARIAAGRLRKWKCAGFDAQRTRELADTALSEL